eukprot:TRINITY_DN1767_c0_g1_i1.p1 TRINITY_DN1767_c0_g1~~TRINITY_DN1767_c0_g1_i1.p1  ORF type:complete len:168 (-),score=35.95 TRINITY_DN1767_c0_g1_i1:127-630(-)
MDLEDGVMQGDDNRELLRIAIRILDGIIYLTVFLLNVVNFLTWPSDLSAHDIFVFFSTRVVVIFLCVFGCLFELPIDALIGALEEDFKIFYTIGGRSIFIGGLGGITMVTSLLADETFSLFLEVIGYVCVVVAIIYIVLHILVRGRGSTWYVQPISAKGGLVLEDHD